MSPVPTHTLKHAIDLAKSGKKDEARALLARILLNNPEHEVTFFWYVDTLPDDKERVRALQDFIKRNPGNTRARAALKALDYSPSLPDSPPTNFGEILQGTYETISPSPANPVIDWSTRESTRSHRIIPVKKRAQSLTMILGYAVLVIILLACCGIVVVPYLLENPSIMTVVYTPEQKYARQMADIIKLTDDMMNGAVLEWDRLMEKPVYEKSTVTNRELLYYNMKMGSADVNVSRDLAPAITKITIKSAEVNTLLMPIEPPKAIAEAHTQVVVCIRYEVEWSTAIFDFLNTSQARQLPQNPCKAFPDAFAKVKNFVEKYQ